MSATLTARVNKLATLTLHNPAHIGFEGADESMKPVLIPLEKPIDNQSGSFDIDNDDYLDSDEEAINQRNLRLTKRAEERAAMMQNGNKENTNLSGKENNNDDSNNHKNSNTSNNNNEKKENGNKKENGHESDSITSLPIGLEQQYIEVPSSKRLVVLGALLRSQISAALARLPHLFSFAFFFSFFFLFVYVVL